MSEINIELNEYVSAKDGSLLIRKNGKWTLTNFEELNKANDPYFKKTNELESEVKALKVNSKHYIRYAKSHFFLVLGYLKTKVLMGEIDIIPVEVWKLEDKVLNNEITVEDALKENELLNHYFNKIFDDKDLLEFPEV